MTDQTESDLRHVFAEDAQRAPSTGALAEAVLRRVRRRRARLAWAAGSSLAAVGAVVVLVGGLVGSGRPGGVAAPAVSPTGGGAQHGAVPVPDPNLASCAATYTPAAVARLSFAFDGTVAGIGAARIEAALPVVAVTFAVNEWFHGGAAPTVTVDMAPPQLVTSQVMDEAVPSYGVGTRLLVSGEPRWGGPALTDAIVWGCGFTRYYDPATADAWRDAFPSN